MEQLRVVKIGGNVINDDTMLQAFLEQFAQLGGRKILVHGGGRLATDLADQLGVPQQMIEGRRITDAETLKIVTMVYAGYINKKIVALLQSYQCDALGICGADGAVIRANKRMTSVDYGFAGDITVIDAQKLDLLTGIFDTIIIAPITANLHGQLLNTNADTIAQEVAKVLTEKYKVDLVYTFEKAGVLSDTQDEHSVIEELDKACYRELKAEQKIFAGMIPKLDNAFQAIDRGVDTVYIGRADALSELIAGHAGTKISL